MSKKVLFGLVLMIVFSIQGRAQDREPSIRNVDYGMYSGLALLLDVYKPADGNGVGIIFINGSGWHAGKEMSANPLKSGYPYMDRIRDALVDAGYTVFSINHRAAPRFKYPDAVDDTRRAVQFVRYHADRFGITGDKLGALGHSSGAHLAAMVGVLDESMEVIEGDPVSEQSAKVWSVVTIAAPMDLSLLSTSGVMAGATPSLVTFLGERPAQSEDGISLEGVYAEASPVSHVSADDASFFIIQGLSDRVVPPDNASVMHSALTQAGVFVKLLELGGGHGPEFDPLLTVEWFDQTLLEE